WDFGHTSEIRLPKSEMIRRWSQTVRRLPAKQSEAGSTPAGVSDVSIAGSGYIFTRRSSSAGPSPSGVVLPRRFPVAEHANRVAPPGPPDPVLIAAVCFERRAAAHRERTGHGVMLRGIRRKRSDPPRRGGPQETGVGRRFLTVEKPFLPNVLAPPRRG